jgi:hypothetical protein
MRRKGANFGVADADFKDVFEREFDERAFGDFSRREKSPKAQFCVRVAHVKLGYRTHVPLSNAQFFNWHTKTIM